MNVVGSLKQLKRASVLILFLVSSLASAQQALTDEQLAQAKQAAERASVDVGQYVQRADNLTDRAQKTAISTDLVPAFGQNLFESGIETSRQSGVNPSYSIAPGDKISVQLWGAVSFAEVLTVDGQGNIFIPDIGPVKVSEINASELNKTVTDRITAIYTSNVNIYVNLLTSTPVGVFVAGPVTRPGQYAGLSSDSILHYLKRAGGIDTERGSFRHITVMRNGKAVQQYDLYTFLRDGVLPAFSFRDQDVILVAQQGHVVTVEGAARNPFRFELSEDASQGSDLIDFANPMAKVSHVAVTGTRASGPISVYMPIDAFSAFDIADGDTVLFNDDLRPQVLSVQVSGSYIGPSYYAVQNDARLHDILAYIEVDPEQANIDAIYIKRESVAERQAELLEESLQRLERSIFTAPASSNGEAQIRGQEAQLVAQFIARARRIEPIGKVVVASNGNVANIRLEQGDEIVIPAKTDLVQVAGEVLMPQAVVFNNNATVSDYIAWAGGFTERANDERIAIVHPNGLLTFVDSDQSGYWYGSSDSIDIQAGDQILVLPAVDNKLMQSVKDITQIIYQIAVAANVAID